MPADTLTLDTAGFPRLGEQPLRLPPKERAALSLLLQRRPAVVAKNDFAAVAWRGGEMSDESLARCISRLRQALAPHGWQIESVYGTGYRLSSETALPAGPAARPAQPSANTLDAYIHARQLAQQRTPEALGRAIALLRELLRSHPEYTPAAVALGDALAAAIGWGQSDTDAAVAEGLQALDDAAARDPATPGLDAARGCLLDMAWRFADAEAAHARALEIGDNDPDTLLLHARHLLFTDRPALAVEQLRRARQQSPHSLMLRMSLSRALVQAGRGVEALAEADAAVADHPGQLLIGAFALSMRAMVAPEPALALPTLRLIEGHDTPPYVWTISSFVLARLGQRDAALDIIDAALLCSRTTTGEATLYAAPLAALGEVDRAAELLRQACDERCGMLAMVLRDPAHAGWLPQHPMGRALLTRVFGPNG
ncbi:MAG TPA: winged helix-turn-helix domain-containing protein [Ideonella sp.]|uniref:winged helix-turn-helix domain-containing protein n=1 Tax=Ideonella sp. TaxID=1929293 RepID=UPI002C08B5C8|nr:winged helix-turn-helix domain-containing protein [Ideonella sp.]HSI47624.1 winged helix-turn-helix domain-containing protein [Ideonella sp.]